MFSLNYNDNFSRKTHEFLTKVEHDPQVLTHINTIIGTNLNQFVPMQSGTLRGSMYGDADGVHWNTPYAHYQYIGDTYGKNKPRTFGGQIVGWRSPPGRGTKSPNGRRLGTPGYWLGWTFGYTTPGTHSEWDREYTTSQWETGSAGVKARINMQITAYVKRIAGIFFAFRNS